MKAPKPLLTVGGERIIDRQISALREVFGGVVLVGDLPAGVSAPGVRVVQDDEAYSGLRGPLTGVYTGIKETGGGFVVACDMPFISPALMAHLAGLSAGHDLVIPVVGGLAEPLFGVYSGSALQVMEEELSRGGRRVQDVFGRLDVRYVGEDELMRFDPGLYSFVNVNTPADLLAAEGLARLLSRPAGACPQAGRVTC